MFEDVLHLNRLKHVHESYLKAVDFKILCHILVLYFIPLYQIIVNNNDNNNDDKININSDYEEINTSIISRGTTIKLIPNWCYAKMKIGGKCKYIIVFLLVKYDEKDKPFSCDLKYQILKIKRFSCATAAGVFRQVLHTKKVGIGNGQYWKLLDDSCELYAVYFRR
ncbi:hypothetical protein C6P42_004903 [Pichia californica]|nr:hypothetical protein C6P42_004903 [[Candida] californica]